MTGPAIDRLPMATKTISETTASGVDSPSWASPAAAPIDRARFFGFTAPSSTPRPSDSAGVSASTRAMCSSASPARPPAWAVSRQSRLARSRNDTPSPIFSHETESDEVSLVPALLWSEMA